jgi:hypothetical protein
MDKKRKTPHLQAGRQKERHAHSQRDRQTEKRTHSQTEGQERDPDRHTERECDTYGQIDRLNEKDVQ